AEPRRARWIVLEFGVARPPARIEAPGRPAQCDRVVEPVELARMIVEDEETSAQGGISERDGVCDEQQSGKKRAAHACRCYGTDGFWLEVPLTFTTFACLLGQLLARSAIQALYAGSWSSFRGSNPCRWRGHGAIEGSQVPRMRPLLSIFTPS